MKNLTRAEVPSIVFPQTLQSTSGTVSAVWCQLGKLCFIAFNLELTKEDYASIGDCGIDRISQFRGTKPNEDLHQPPLEG